MSSKNIFTGEPKDAERKPLQEPIAAILARAQANNPLPHQSGLRGLCGLGAGRRTGRLTRGRGRRERARGDLLFGIKGEKS